jgi:hypothetical protein
MTTLVERAGIDGEEAVALYWEQLAWWQYRREIFSHALELRGPVRLPVR